MVTIGKRTARETGHGSSVLEHGTKFTSLKIVICRFQTRDISFIPLCSCHFPLNEKCPLDIFVVVPADKTAQ